MTTGLVADLAKMEVCLCIIQLSGSGLALVSSFADEACRTFFSLQVFGLDFER